MFSQVQDIRDAWIAKREALLSDALLLAGHFSPASQEDLRSFAKALAHVFNQREYLFRDAFFHCWLDDLKTSLLDVVEGRVQVWDQSILGAGRAILETLRSTPNSEQLVDGHANLPRSGHIKILNREAAIIHRTELDYELDWNFALDEKKWVASLTEALKLIERHEPSRQLVRAFASYIAPLGTRSSTQNISFSVRKFPNVIFKNDELSHHLFAETLVHECDHQFYYALEELYPLWSTDTARTEAYFYSPWRDDPRPLDGILRGLSAFTRVCEFYASILPDLDKDATETMGQLLVTRLTQCRIGLEALLAQDAFTEVGWTYLREMGSVLTSNHARVALFANYSRWHRRALECTEAHQVAWQGRYVHPQDA